MDFPAIMVTLVLVTGMIWWIDTLFWEPQRTKSQKEPVVVEYARSFFPIILLVLVVRSFIIEPFRIPTVSMLPTLHIGDFILVNKFSYGFRLPVLNFKVLELGKPERGDVAVFRFPRNTKIDYIKRVVGLPGDKIGYFDKTVFINGRSVEQDVKVKDTNLLRLVPIESKLIFEHLGDYGHNLLVGPDPDLVEGEMVVPVGHYFVMGDNRDNSSDSRFWGTVPEENLVGKAIVVWMSWDWNAGGIVWNRLGNSID